MSYSTVIFLHNGITGGAASCIYERYIVDRIRLKVSGYLIRGRTGKGRVGPETRESGANRSKRFFRRKFVINVTSVLFKIVSSPPAPPSHLTVARVDPFPELCSPRLLSPQNPVVTTAQYRIKRCVYELFKK